MRTSDGEFDPDWWYPSFSDRIHAYEMTQAWADRSREFRWNRPICEACGRRTLLHAHHVTYDRAFYGDEPDEDLRALCPPCHRSVHDLVNMYGWELLAATEQVIQGSQSTTVWAVPRDNNRNWALAVTLIVILTIFILSLVLG